ncbi:MAG: LiaF transmembrane domain-containing protein [Lachnospiraceae bacterium]
MKTNKLLWGVFFIAAAILIVVNKLGYFTGINVWSLLFTIVLVPVVVSGAVRRNFFNLFFGIAFLLIVYAKPLNITALVPWTVLIAALLLSIGFSILVPSKYKWKDRTYQHHSSWYKHDSDYEKYETVDHLDGNEVNCNVSMAGSCKYLHSDNLERGSFECSLGYLKVYFDNVRLHPDGAVICVNCSLGSTELYIPRDWKIVLNVDSVLGNVGEQPRTQMGAGPVLTITGTVHLGNLEIKYI